MKRGNGREANVEGSSCSKAFALSRFQVLFNVQVLKRLVFFLAPPPAGFSFLSSRVSSFFFGNVRRYFQMEMNGNIGFFFLSLSLSLPRNVLEQGSEKENRKRTLKIFEKTRGRGGGFFLSYFFLIGGGCRKHVLKSSIPPLS